MVVIIEGREWTRIWAKINEVVSAKQPRLIFDYEVNFANFQAQVAQSNIFSETNCAYILKNATFLGEAQPFKEMAKWLEYWLPIWENDPQNYFLITPKLLKNQKIKRLLEGIQTFTLEPLTVANQEQFIQEQLKIQKLSLSPESIKVFSRLMPPNAEWIVSAIEKLKHYDPIPTPNQLREIVYPAPETDLFQLWELILRQDTAQALRLWNSLFTQGDPFQLVALLSTQMLNSFLLRTALDQGLDHQAMIERYKFNPYFLRMQIPLLKGWTTNEIRHLIEELFKIEILIKLENIDSLLMLKFFLLKFCFKGINH